MERLIEHLLLGLVCVSIGILCSLVSQGASKEPTNEGECSRFVYEYKLMERLVKLELDKTAMYNKIAELEEKYDTVTKSKVQPSSQLLAVKVGLSAAKKVKVGDRIIYDRVISNEGDAYNTRTGIFEAPVSGVYSFAVSVCLKDGWMALTVVRNLSVIIIGQIFSGGRGCTNDYTTVKLDFGDRVWVEKKMSALDVLDEDFGWNSFSVNLIQKV